MAQNILTAIIRGDGSQFEKTINEMKADLKSFQKQLADVPVGSQAFDDLTNAITNEKNAIQQAEAGQRAFSNSSFGVSRAGRIAHNDLDQMVRSFELIGKGGEGAGAALSNMTFTFERLIGASGGLKAGLSALLDSLLGPAGIILAVSTLIQFGPELISFFTGGQHASDEFKSSVDELKKSLDKLKEPINIQIAGAVGAKQDEVVKLRTLVAASTRVDIENGKETVQSINNRRTAFNELLKLYPKEFENQKFETTLTDKGTEAILRADTTLERKITRAATFETTSKLVSETSSKLFQADATIGDIQKKIDEQLKIENDIIDQRNAERKKNTLPEFFVPEEHVTTTPAVKELRKQLEEANRIRNEIDVQNQLNKEVERKTVVAQIQAGDFKIDEKKLKEGLSDAQRNLIKLAETGQKFFEIPIDLKITNLDSEAQKLSKAIKIVTGIQTVQFKLKVDTTEVTSAFERTKNIKPEELPKDVIEKSFEKVPDVVQEGIKKGIIEGSTIRPNLSPFSKEIQDVLSEFEKEGLKIPVVLDLKDADLLNKLRSTLHIEQLQKDLKKSTSFEGILTSTVDLNNIAKFGDLSKDKLEELRGSVVTTADTVRGLLVPAFQDMFDLTKKQNPLEAFFKGLIQSVNELVKRIIQATIEATILSKVGKGQAGTDFNTLFKQLFGITTVNALKPPINVTPTTPTSIPSVGSPIGGVFGGQTANAALNTLSESTKNAATGMAPLITTDSALVASQQTLIGSMAGQNIATSTTTNQFAALSLALKLASSALLKFVASAQTSSAGGTSGAGVSLIQNLLMMVPGFAEGGRPQLGKVAVVGEKGPELFVPDSAGMIYSNKETMKILGLSNISNSIKESSELVKSISGFRQFGGPVTGGGTFLVGESGKELFIPNSFSVPRVSTPTPTTQNISGGMRVEVTGEFVQRGQNLVAVISQVNRSNGRNF